ncbi:MAG: histidine kinase [Chitinophagaceae bacterium]
MKQSIAETQMQVLRSQMNPHFIFNCLNSIDAFIQSNDKYNATLYLNKFAKLIRNLLDSSKQDIVAFSKDIETLKLYIELEQQRSENKFAVDIVIDPELMNGDYKVPPLIIQPFVENAIIHGLRNRDDNRGLLTVNIAKTENRIIYIVTDNGIGRAAATRLRNNKSNSYGLEMSYERVMLFNKEPVPSIDITDLYEGEKACGTRVQLQLNII